MNHPCLLHPLVFEKKNPSFYTRTPIPTTTAIPTPISGNEGWNGCECWQASCRYPSAKFMVERLSHNGDRGVQGRYKHSGMNALHQPFTLTVRFATYRSFSRNNPRQGIAGGSWEITLNKMRALWTTEVEGLSIMDGRCKS